jgi:hypothetical protein
MPYITQDDRKLYEPELSVLNGTLEELGHTSGTVTYILYMIVARWFKLEPSYNTIAKIRGCLIGTLAEFDRRIAAPYEDKKIRENGDVDLDAAFDDCNEDEFGRCVFNTPVESEPKEGDPDSDQCEHMCSSPSCCEICIAEAHFRDEFTGDTRGGA